MLIRIKIGIFALELPFTRKFPEYDNLKFTTNLF